ncbi:Unknown protein sequence [Pseudomonas syringae pv. coryli]|uniref:Uncharacterized protein n=1 Tax=Pseudomonas syringae pv. coryli TaxID=317659 RepID=A0A0P9N4P7_9PSED|nr:Unknown protein sequence [Pseudomonas syringae pv. coryli]
MGNQCEKLFAFTWIYTIKNSRMLHQAQNRIQTPSFLTLRMGIQFWTLRELKGLHRWVTHSVTKGMPTRSIGTIVMLCEAQNRSQTPSFLMLRVGMQFWTLRVHSGNSRGGTVG